MPLPVLDPEQLHVLVFGPGTGELVAVRAPPGAWLIVDGCSAKAVRYGLAMLRHYGETPALVALTHPHMDHAAGVAEVIDAATQGPMDTWPKLGLVWPGPSARAGKRDLVAQLSAGYAQHAVSAILDRWERAPGSRWNLAVGKTAGFGQATVKVLSPTRAEVKRSFRTLRTTKSFAPNRLATAFELAWRGHRVLLGSDVEKPAWAMIQKNRLRPGAVTTKVPHHGSINAAHDIWIKPAKGGTQLFVVTPFAAPNLPRFDAQGGVAKMLLHAEHVHLTGLPRSHAGQSAVAQTLKRKALETIGKEGLDPKTPGFPDCFVIVSIAADGVANVTHGPGSVRVAR